MIWRASQAWPRRRIGDIVTSVRAKLGEQVDSFFREKNGISIADIQTKVVKVVTISPMRLRDQAWLALHIILITPNLLTLSIWILVLPSFVGLSSCCRQELCRLVVDKNASLSDRNSPFVLDLSSCHRVSKTHFGLLVKILVKCMAFNQEIGNSGVAHCFPRTCIYQDMCILLRNFTLALQACP